MAKHRQNEIRRRGYIILKVIFMLVVVSKNMEYNKLENQLHFFFKVR